MDEAVIFRDLARVRALETELLTLFSQGKLNGTTHTCIGQEAVALTVMSAIDRKRDCVFSNHRGHGHFLCYGGPMDALLAEIMGKRGAACNGLGGSQHLHYKNYYSNGIQGGIAPVTAGIALAEKVRDTGAIACVFLGDGTLGQGVVYETFNIASLWNLPVLFVIEHNHYAQSTPTATTIAGGIEARAQAFGIDSATLKIEDIGAAIVQTKKVVDTIRRTQRPFVQVFDTYRLAAHSKGDDDRSPDEIAAKRREDPYELLRATLGERAVAIEAEQRREVLAVVADVAARPDVELDDSLIASYQPGADSTTFGSLIVKPEQAGRRQISEINAALHDVMAADERVYCLGEDLVDPYGGAFKATRGLSTRFPDRVINTPISEAALTGVGIGMAMRGLRPVIEVMFGDFLALCFDQLLNNASKFPYMFGGEVSVPLLLRTPMGGRRGYGPTHSQCLEKLFLGVPGLAVVAASLRHDPRALLHRAIFDDERPTLLVETKIDYARELGAPLPPGYRLDEVETSMLYPTLRLTPTVGSAEVTIVTYGGMLPEVEQALTRLQLERELQAEVFVVTELGAPPWKDIEASLGRTHRLLTVEEGSEAAGFGSYLAGHLLETMNGVRVVARRVAAPNVPIPASRHLEASHLPSAEHVIDAAVELALY